jgi:hypothetical protein
VVAGRIGVKEEKYCHEETVLLRERLLNKIAKLD